MAPGLTTPGRVLGVLAIAELLAMAPWFSASAVAPTLARVWHLSPAGTSWLTISVQLGFVAGALVSAIFTLADRFSARRLVAGCAALAAAATIGVADRIRNGRSVPASHRRRVGGRLPSRDEDRGGMV